MQRVIILGGSFNPVHIGHMRLAIEAKEVLRANRVDFVPCYNPPHKTSKALLPFEFRVEALRRAIAELANLENLPQCLGFKINEFEAGFDLPSYTVYTLENYRKTEPEAELWFVLGLSDYIQLPSWFRWQELPSLTNLAVVPRQGHDLQTFCQTTRAHWPQSHETQPQISELKEPGELKELGELGELKKLGVPAFCACPKFAKEKYGKIQFLPLPRIDISSSLIRDKWLKNESLQYLLPGNVQNLLRENEILLNRYWHY